MEMLHFLGSTSWHLDNTMNDMLRVVDEEGRPASPVRGPPSSVADNIHLAPDNQRSSHVREDIGFDVDFVEYGNGAANRTNQHSSIDASQLFEELMEDNYENFRPSSGRGRSARGRQGSRGRGRQSRGRSNGRVCAQPSQRPAAQPPPPPPPAPSPERTQSRSDNPLRNEVFSDAEELPDDTEECRGLRRWRECIICNARVGRYVLLPCRGFPVCGSCLHRWFVEFRNDNCPHCRGPVVGWLRLNI
ncbi:uncharacterized protein LOC113215598 [Frankliniella occidentalis]|uniref:Uncharacterized protein LOC113215598 n=1 Tax=Frankliniella occidentalis TaxID=133901 RepID=A0A9C6XTT7_FRAOC|nr:uncharacterized protein LOC113215598 [Frankliniella occidentalis]